MVDSGRGGGVDKTEVVLKSIRCFGSRHHEGGSDTGKGGSGCSGVTVGGYEGGGVGSRSARAVSRTSSRWDVPVAASRVATRRPICPVEPVMAIVW